MHPKKVLFIGQLPPPVHGVTMMNELVVESLMTSEYFDLETIKLQFAKSVEEISKFTFWKLLKTLIYSFQIFFKSIRYQPDLVYFTITPGGAAFIRDILFVIALRITNSKIVYHLHGQGIKQNIQKSRWKRIIYQWVFKKAHIICLSELLTKDLNEICQRTPYIIPNGIKKVSDINMIKKDVGKEPQIIYLSNFFRSKGILILLDALHILNESGIRFTANLVGAPGDVSLAFLEKKIRSLSLENRVLITGPIFGQKKFIALNQADIFVQPTYFDAFPLTILEAMQCKLPVISTFEGGIPDIVLDNETGLLFERGNIVKLVQCLSLLLNSEPLRTKMGEAGFRRYEKLFTSGRFTKDLTTLLMDLS